MGILSEMRYSREEDVAMRLNKTVIRYKGEPVFVDFSDNLHVIGINLVDGKEIRVHSSDEDLDISSPPLGNNNGKEDPCLYVVRQPAREQKQGFHLHSGIVYERGAWSRGYRRNARNLADTVLGKYPSPKDAIRSVELRGVSKAFSRYFSFEPTQSKNILALKHLIDFVGVYLKHEKVVLLTGDVINERMKSQLSEYDFSVEEIRSKNEP